MIPCTCVPVILSILANVARCSQLLEVLLELNDSLYLSPNLRYHLSAPGDPDYVPPQARDRPQDRAQIERARIALEEARQSLSRGATSREAYRALEQRVRDANIFAPHTEYAILAQIQPPETQAKLDRPESEAACDTALGYFTPEHETEYYLALDAKLGDRAAELELDRAPEKPSFAERERDAAMRNPTSVYNWLRRNQPQIFLQDNEVASEKSASKPANVRTSKRPPVSARREEEMYDEDGIALDLGPAPKNKRKRDEDTGYRPKGGSSRPRKRKDDASKRAAKRSSGVGA